MTVSASVPIDASVEIIYPASDEELIGETGFHVTLMVNVITSLRVFFYHRDDVYVGGSMFMYYEEGDPTKVITPDIFVVFGVDGYQRRERTSWFTWREGKAADVVFEFTSKETWKRIRTPRKRFTRAWVSRNISCLTRFRSTCLAS